MIRRIWIEGYKSFRNFSLELRPLSVIFGPNAAGKSNLLDALYLLSRAVTCGNLQEAFKGHRGLPLESFYCGDEGYEWLLKQSEVSLTFQVDVELSEDVCKKVMALIHEKRKGIPSADLQRELIRERRLRYRLEIEAFPRTGVLRVKDERLSAIRENGEEKKSRDPFVSREGDKIWLRLEGQAHPTGHDVGLDHTIVSTALYEPHYPHITAFRQELANWRFYYLEPRDLMREEVPLAEVTSLGPRGENLAAFLNVLKHEHAPDYQSLNLALRRVLPVDASIDVDVSKLGLVGLRLVENGTSYSARLISEGTLRIIGLLVACHPANLATLLAYEEPENGVHPVRLRIISDIFKYAASVYEKQVILTTHSPQLPKYFDNTNLFVCRKENRQTIIEPFRGWGPLFRKQQIREIMEALDDRILRGDFGG